jgi:hypothetical protein
MGQHGEISQTLTQSESLTQEYTLHEFIYMMLEYAKLI